jgi:hypothetical protein
MSDQEALMWALEQDPVLRSTFAQLTLLDRPPDLARYRERMARCTRLVPRLRQRVVDPIGGIWAPEWVDDALFDLDFHVRHVRVPAPGTLRQLLDLAALLSSDPFDRARPLWQFMVIDGLADGTGALLAKLHHTITDGEGGVRLSALFVDLERDPGPEPPVEEPPAGAPEAEEAAAGDGLGRNPVVAVADNLLGGVRGGLDFARRTLTGAGDAMTHPTTVPEKAAGALDASRSLFRQATVNDLFVTGAVGAAGAYHRAKGAPVDELRMAMPVSTRTDRGSGGNAFAPTRLLVPTGIEDPFERFHAVREVLDVTRGERVLGITGGLAAVLGALPSPLLVRLARQQVGTVDFTTSNVRGAPFELYIGGARVLANYPLGPMAGTAFNLTTLSYKGQLDMGCLVDAAAVDDPALLRRCLLEAYDELLALAPAGAGV